MACIYRLESTRITSSNVEKDLGILVDNKLKFLEQCSVVVAKANKILGMICLSFDYTNAEMILQLYKSLVLATSYRIWKYHLGSLLRYGPISY